MNKTAVYTTVLLIVTACMVLFSMGASAQEIPVTALPTPEQTKSAYDQMLDKGILGVLALVQMAVIAQLFKELKTNQKAVLDWAVKATEGSTRMEVALVKATEQLAKNEALTVRMLDKMP